MTDRRDEIPQSVRRFRRRHVAFGNRTIYTNITIPFTRAGIILDVGLHACVGYTLRARSQRWPDWSKLSCGDDIPF